jgi:hypothetical protein
MGTRSVRLDEETEKELRRLTKMTGLSVSEILKRGVLAYGNVARHEWAGRPFDIYQVLDLGPGGYARAPAKDAKSTIASVVGHKHRK